MAINTFKAIATFANAVEFGSIVIVVRQLNQG